MLHFEIFGVQLQFILLFAGWVVYKFQHFIWKDKMEDTPGEQYGPEYKTQQEAYVKTRRKLKEDFPESNDLVNVQGKSDEEGFYFVIEIWHTVVKLIFIPVPVKK